MNNCNKIKTIAAIVLCVFFLTSLVPINVEAADTPVKVNLTGSGSMPWSISNIKPGDRGIQTIALQNAGYNDGRLTVWISDVVDKEGANPESESGNNIDPGELGSCLAFKFSATGLNSNLVFPVSIYDFPRSTSDSRFIQINLVRAGSSVDLIWEWILPDDIGNDVQGDALSFTVNYILEDFTAVAGGAGVNATGGTTQTIEIISRDSGARITIQSDGVITENRIVTLVENKLVLSFEQGTQIFISSFQAENGAGYNIVTYEGRAPSKIEVEVIEEPPPAPAGTVVVGQVYDLFAVDEFGRVSIYFSSPFKLVLNYDAGLLPDNVLSLYLAYYDEVKNEWVRLDPPEWFIAGAGQAAAEVNHFTLFAVLAELAPTQSLPVPRPPALARFQLQNMDISPRRIWVGDTVNINSTIVNLGEQPGDYLLTVRIAGLLETTRTIRLNPGESQELSFQVTPTRPGVYQARIGDLRGGFVVEEFPTPTPIYTPTPAPAYPLEGSHAVYSWLTLSILAIMALFGATALVLAYKRRHTRR